MNLLLNRLSLTAPLQSFWLWLMAEPGIQKKQRQFANPQRTRAEVGHCVAGKPRPQAAPFHPLQSPRCPVRVLQVMDSSDKPNQIGRLRISGRMADVCAELDRLAAREILLN